MHSVIVSSQNAIFNHINVKYSLVRSSPMILISNVELQCYPAQLMGIIVLLVSIAAKSHLQMVARWIANKLFANGIIQPTLV